MPVVSGARTVESTLVVVLVVCLLMIPEGNETCVKIVVTCAFAKRIPAKRKYNKAATKTQPLHLLHLVHPAFKIVAPKALVSSFARMLN